MQATRRVVTGHDDQGKAVVLYDGPAPNMKQRKAGGNVLTMLWVTDENPSDMDNHANRPEFVAALAGKIGLGERRSPTLGVPFLYVAAPVSGGAVRLAYPLSDVDGVQTQVRRRMLWGAALALLIALVVASGASVWISRRLERIVIAMAEGGAEEDVPAHLARERRAFRLHPRLDVAVTGFPHHRPPAERQARVAATTLLQGDCRKELKKLASLYKRPVTHFTGEDPADQVVGEDVAHLARKASELSAEDRAELGRFADFLRAKKQSKGG